MPAKIVNIMVGREILVELQSLSDRMGRRKTPKPLVVASHLKSTRKFTFSSAVFAWICSGWLVLNARRRMPRQGVRRRHANVRFISRVQKRLVWWKECGWQIRTETLKFVTGEKPVPFCFDVSTRVCLCCLPCIFPLLHLSAVGQKLSLRLPKGREEKGPAILQQNQIWACFPSYYFRVYCSKAHFRDDLEQINTEEEGKCYF